MRGINSIKFNPGSKYPEIKNLNPHNALYDTYLCLELLKIRLGK